MERKNTKMELPEAQPAAAEPTATPEPRPWVTPAFERVPLNEALAGAAGFWDGGGFSYS